jgi:hypothetical protein
MSFRFAHDRLEELATERHESYASVQPFPHTVIDDFLPADTLDDVLVEFPAPDAEAWFAYDSARERKLEFTDQSHMGPATRHLLEELNGSLFVGFLERLTGIHGLIPDPHLEGGGLHQITPGGYLEVHADFSRHHRLRLDRRLNLLLYLNRDWKENYGGQLELWNRTMTHCQQRILPIFNRCVIFNTTSWSYHGHPHPLACPDGMTRKSIALYYYRSSSPSEGEPPSHGTLFQTRPSRAQRALKRILPPVLVDALRPVRNRVRSLPRRH